MVGTEIACNIARGVIMFFESLVAGSLRLGTHGVVAASMGLHVVPGTDSPLGIPKVPSRQLIGKREPFWFTSRLMA